MGTFQIDFMADSATHEQLKGFEDKYKSIIKYIEPKKVRLQINQTQ